SSQQLKIYFAGSIAAGRGDAALYESLVQHLSKHGCVLTEHVAKPERLARMGFKSDTEIYGQDMAWLTECDCLVAEVSIPSLGVGYEIGQAVAMEKPTLCLFRLNSEGEPVHGKHLSSMVAGCPEVQTRLYREESEALAAIDKFLARLKS
ncbi:hypothetical protein BOX15_Mlig022662g1, partial [Macrostomum lignano]